MAIDLFLCTLTKCKTVGVVHVFIFDELRIVTLAKLTVAYWQPRVRRIAHLLSEHILPMVCKRDFGLKQEFEGKLSRVATNLECISPSLPRLLLFAVQNLHLILTWRFCTTNFNSVSSIRITNLVSATAIPRDYCSFCCLSQPHPTRARQLLMPTTGPQRGVCKADS